MKRAVLHLVMPNSEALSQRLQHAHNRVTRSATAHYEVLYPLSEGIITGL